MRQTGRTSLSTRLRVLLDSLVVISALLVATEAFVAIVLLDDPLNPMRRYFQVTTTTMVGDGVWPTAGLVQIAGNDATATVDPMAFIAFRPASRVFVLATLAASLSWWACFILVLLQLRGVCANVSSGTPFPRDNIRRIRLLGWLIIGTAAADLLIDAGVVTYMWARVTVGGSPAMVPGVLLLDEFPFGTILAGLAVLVLAEVFRSGADLQDEQSLTV